MASHGAGSARVQHAAEQSRRCRPAACSNNGSQQPLAQLVESQVPLEVPPPVPELVPQAPALHVSLPVHGAQAAPEMPQSAVVGGSTHVEPEQQPTQVAGLHVVEVMHAPLTQL